MSHGSPIPRAAGASFLSRFETPEQKRRREAIAEARTRLREVDRQLQAPAAQLSLEDRLGRGLITRQTFESLLAEREGFQIPTEGKPFIQPASAEPVILPVIGRGIERFVDPLQADVAQLFQRDPLELALAKLSGQEPRFGVKEAPPGGREPLIDLFKAAFGDKEEREKEQLRAQEVLAEIGFVPRLILAIFDFSLLLPGVGFTKISQFKTLLRIATGGGKSAAAAKVAIANHEVVAEARRLLVKEGIASTDRSVAETAFSTIVQEERRIAQQLTPDVGRVTFGEPGLAATEPTGLEALLFSKSAPNATAVKNFSKERLLEIAAERGVTVSPRATKIEIVKAIKAKGIEGAVDVTAVSKLSIDDAISRAIKEMDEAKGVDKVFARQSVVDLKAAKVQGRTEVPLDFFERGVAPRRAPKEVAKAITKKPQLGNLRRVLKDIVQGNPSTDANVILRSGIEATLRDLKITAEEVLESGRLELLTTPRLTPKAAEIIEMRDLLAGRVKELGGDPSAISNLSDEALEAASTPRVVEPSSVPVETRRLDDISKGADTPKGDPGVASQVADDAGEFAAQTTRSAEEVGNTFVTHLRPIEELIPEVVTKDNRVTRWLIGNTGVNASILTFR